CDGNSVAGAAFGGATLFWPAAPGVYQTPAHPPDAPSVPGPPAPRGTPTTHPGNAYWFQALRANEVFKALDGKQRTLALRTDARKEEGTKTVELAGKSGELHGIAVSDLSHDQKDLVRKVMADLLAPFRKADS